MYTSRPQNAKLEQKITYTPRYIICVGLYVFLFQNSALCDQMINGRILHQKNQYFIVFSKEDLFFSNLKSKKYFLFYLYFNILDICLIRKEWKESYNKSCNRTLNHIFVVLLVVYRKIWWKRCKKQVRIFQTNILSIGEITISYLLNCINCGMKNTKSYKNIEDH